MSAGQSPDRPRPMSARVRAPLVIAGLLLGVSIIVPLLVPTYSRAEPEFLGFPFFYWYQLGWVFLCAVLVVISHRLVRQHEERKREELGLGPHHHDDTDGGAR